MGDTLMTLIVGHPEVDLFYEHRKDGAFFSLDTREIRAELGDVPLNAPQIFRPCAPAFYPACKSWGSEEERTLTEEGHQL